MVRMLSWWTTLLVLAAFPSVSGSTTVEIPPVSAVGYENDIAGCTPNPIRQDVSSEVSELDGVFAPRTEPCVDVDYFATGRSAGYLDALSLSFDLSELPPGTLVYSIRLRAYLRKGTYWDAAWHAARLYPGALSAVGEDCDFGSGCWGPHDEFPADPGWEGWIERNVPTLWVQAGELDLSLRIWNASVDQVVLEVTYGPPQSSSLLVAATGFEDDYTGCGTGPTQQEILADVIEREGFSAPRAEGCVYVDYFANGGSQGWLDAIAARFDLSSVSSATPTPPLTLRAYVQLGPFSPDWHAWKLYPGLFNPQDQGCDSYRQCWTAADEFPGTTNWEGWIERSIPAEWISGDMLELTIRFWNARVDALRLDVEAPTSVKPKSWGALKARYKR